MVSEAVKLFSARKVPFAVRGGGALPIDDAANIAGHGILISSSNMSSITVSADRKTVSVGSGVRWPQLYEFLDPLDLAVNGVRLGDTGVAGFHLGGGVGFYSNEHGMGPKTIKEFEVR
jgi:FAD/FMN-containing dehydrogenase